MKESLHIKNMVCDRCIEAVTEALQSAHIPFREVQLGQVSGVHANQQQLESLALYLQKRGFQLLEDSNEQWVSRIKTALLQSILEPGLLGNQNHSTYLEQRLEKDYTSLSRIFSSSTGTTIEKHLINQRIERAKELISYGELSISEIANHLGYSSVQHLSTQFKKIVGVTPSQYLKSNQLTRKGLDQV
ncbi:MAG: helix-turn-helix domain-containing protein [Cytophagales bacterium]|nr:helix-turn-helix domain-containing protein [Cytophagales bacterium]